jgi:hypothetical protein
MMQEVKECNPYGGLPRSFLQEAASLFKKELHEASSAQQLAASAMEEASQQLETQKKLHKEASDNVSKCAKLRNQKAQTQPH